MTYLEKVEELEYVLQGITPTGLKGLIKILQNKSFSNAEKIEIDRIKYALEHPTPLKTN